MIRKQEEAEEDDDKDDDDDGGSFCRETWNQSIKQLEFECKLTNQVELLQYDLAEIQQKLLSRKGD